MSSGRQYGGSIQLGTSVMFHSNTEPVTVVRDVYPGSIRKIASMHCSGLKFDRPKERLSENRNDRPPAIPDQSPGSGLRDFKRLFGSWSSDAHHGNLAEPFYVGKRRPIVRHSREGPADWVGLIRVIKEERADGILSSVRSSCNI